jgi:hypothetical protein
MACSAIAGQSELMTVRNLGNSYYAMDRYADALKLRLKAMLSPYHRGTLNPSPWRSWRGLFCFYKTSIAAAACRSTQPGFSSIPIVRRPLLPRDRGSQ